MGGFGFYLAAAADWRELPADVEYEAEAGIYSWAYLYDLGARKQAPTA
ncbi:hypothetical protein HaLaN_10107 [Haematococcus lacustris]|uniref:Uncharacterized protein n=1 Tax=Haematococcus lacustris TaxID=44745 RepID=A0A699Z5C2_HAELA|nr:hypothetical protein HaLaN_10107 [Haematococcus lacustris]